MTTTENSNVPFGRDQDPQNSASHVSNGQYRPITPQDLAKPLGQDDSGVFGGLNSAQARMIAVPVFLSLYFFSQEHLELTPITIGVLLACLLFRMKKSHSQIMGVPLTLAALRLATQIANSFPLLGSLNTAAAIKASSDQALRIGLPWLPMFFAACLFYMPSGDSHTSKIVVSSSVLLLTSGLLPGDGFSTIFLFVFGLLFLALLIAFAMDFKLVDSALQPRPLAQAARS
jgi:hypothetical protein